MRVKHTKTCLVRYALPPPPPKHSVVGKVYFLSTFFLLRDHALLHKGLFFERPIKSLAQQQREVKFITLGKPDVKM